MKIYKDEVNVFNSLKTKARMHQQQQYRRYEEDIDYSMTKLKLDEMSQYDTRLAALQDENQRLSQRLNRVEMQLEQLLRSGGVGGVGGYGKYYSQEYSDPSDPIGYMQAVRDRERKRVHLEQGRWDNSMRYSKYNYDDPLMDNTSGIPRRRLSVLDRDAVKQTHSQSSRIARMNGKGRPKIESDKGSDDDNPIDERNKR